MKVKLMDLVVDPELIVRDLNLTVVGQYVESMRAGEIFPPILIDKKNRIICGQHRYNAFKKVFEPDYEVECEVSKKTKEVDLIIEAVKDNVRHGYPLATFDKKKILFRLSDLGVNKNMTLFQSIL